MNSIYQLDASQFTAIDWFVLALISSCVIWSFVAIFWLMRLGFRHAELEGELKTIQSNYEDQISMSNRWYNKTVAANKRIDNLLLERENKLKYAARDSTVSKDKFNTHMKDNSTSNKTSSRVGNKQPSSRKRPTDPEK